MITNFSSLIWNCQGCGKPSFVAFLKEYMIAHRINLIALLETRISSSNVDKVIGKIGYPNSHRVEACGFSGGIWLCWDNDIDIHILYNHSQFIHMKVTRLDSNTSFLFTVVYGSPNPSLRRSLWKDLGWIASSIQEPWMLAGDFNSILSALDRKGGSPTNAHGNREFQNFIMNFGLKDWSYKGPKFTWSSGDLFQRLDWVLANAVWDDSFSNMTLKHLDKLTSDHRPLLVEMGCKQSRQERPFRFFSGWLEHESFDELVANTWRAKPHLSETIHEFTKEVQVWNKEVYGNIFATKQKLLRRIQGAQAMLEKKFTIRLKSIEEDLRRQLEEVLIIEEKLWHQKSRKMWVLDGDRNTKFYHRATMNMRRKNRVIALKNSDNNWTYNETDLKNSAVAFYKNLFTADGCGNSRWQLRGKFPSIQADHMVELRKDVSDEEIKAALFSMGPLKAPGVDGLNAQFFQKQWKTIGNSVCKAIRDYFKGASWDPNLNKTLLVLIPKTDSPETFSQFRPISLCSILYKIMAKVVANRLKPLMPSLIAPNQTSFVHGRNITDNIIIAQEVIHSFRKMKGKKGWLAIKIDLEKAYDRIRWDYLEDTFHDIGFPISLSNIMMKCISSSFMQVV